MNEMMSSNTPSIINAAILPPAEIFLISNKNSFIKATEKRLKDIMSSVLYLCRMPSHMMAKEQSAHTMVSPAFEYCCKDISLFCMEEVAKI